MNTLWTRVRNAGMGIALSGACLPVLLSMNVHAEVSGATMADFTSYPVISTESAVPEVMLTMSKDHQLFFKVYNDFSDLDGDGDVDTTYDNDIDYFGYFDQDKCYSYQNGLDRFQPEYFTADHHCDNAPGEWSGNFLNWATTGRFDAVRKILYGGSRSTDTGTLTVLERVQLPHDAHSWVKYYNGDDVDRLTPFDPPVDADGGDGDGEDDIDEGITICNTTDGANDNDNSTTTTQPPLLKAAAGNYLLWASNERWQCTWTTEPPWDGAPDRGNANAAGSGIDAANNDPDEAADGLTHAGAGPDFVVRVEVCSDEPLFALEGDNNENCKRYPDGNLKPIGLLQQFGEDERIHFGLMTGSYHKNLTGGVLRKNTGPLADEINVLSDGTFKPLPADGGIIHALESLRLFGYRYDDGQYRGGLSDELDDCPFQLGRNPGDVDFDGRCMSWGNPIGEMYVEALRYLAGEAGPRAEFDTDDSDLFPGLVPVAWEDPLAAENQCASLSTVVFNASVNSRDDDLMSVIADLPGADASTAAKFTTVIGDEEGLHGNSFFIGQDADETDEFCTPKTVDDLATAKGVCPEAPTLNGSYQVAGAAYFARVNDIRDDFDGEQTVRTFAVALSPNVPRIIVPVPGSGEIVTILPAYRQDREEFLPGGQLVEFKVVQPHTETVPGQTATGKFYVNWEVNEQGNDYDQDLWGTIEYVIDSAANAIEITTELFSESSGAGQLFGFILSGTTQDGFHAYSGSDNVVFNDPDPTINDCAGGCNVADGPSVEKFELGASGTTLLEQPLFYAAKWGGFTDLDGDDLPNLTEEFDQNDTSGAPVEGGDGIPDNFFFVTDPGALEASLTTVFNEIVEKTASGTAAAVVANTQAGLGAAFQALYEPLRSDTAQREVKWIGTLHALWIDEFGLLREDNPGGTPNGVLDDYNTDPVVEVFFDPDEKITRIRRFSSSDDDVFIESGSSELALEEISPIWNAREQLSAVVDPVIQRPYGTGADPTADTGRHLITWVDDNNNGAVDAGEQIDFDTTDIDAGNFGFLDVATLAQAHDIVNFVRGEEQAGFRNRSIDFDPNDGGAVGVEVMRLADIIHSTPTPAAAPSEAFDLLFGDSSYAEFRDQYANRRQVVYVGSNSGGVHAFNAGFFNTADSAFEVELGGETEHPLGSELWMYVPKNVLHTLKYLGDPAYTHLYYADLTPRVFDAKVFPDDAVHPEGWGTVLVIGMRLGSGGSAANAFAIDTDADGLGGNDADGDTADDQVMRSGFAVLDVTDPERPPTVLGEIVHPDLGYSTSSPEIVFFLDDNEWYLVFGNGPNDLGTATSTQDAKVFVYNLEDIVNGEAVTDPNDPLLIAGGGLERVFDLAGDPTGFVGDTLSVDWDLDGANNFMYFGTVTGSASTPGGRFYRIGSDEDSDVTQWNAPESLIEPNPGQPFLTLPTATLDEKAQRWVFASTGRFFVNTDRGSSPQQTLYGILDKETSPAAFPLSGGELIDTTDSQVFADGSLEGVTDPGGDDIDTFTALITEVEEAGGWKLDYEADGVNPSQRGVVTSALIGGILFNPAFTPSEDLCASEGDSVLFGLFFKTGTAIPEPAVFGTDCTVVAQECPEDKLESVKSVVLGPGLASSPSIHVGAGLGEKEVTVVEQTSTGAIVLEQATTASSPKSAEISWREY